MFQHQSDDDIEYECARHNLINRYRMMKCPFKKQRLNLLYPGRFIEQDYEASGYNIPNENEGLEKSKKMSESLRKAYELENEALSRHLGGEYKIFPFPAVEPEAVIDDPRLKGLNIDILKEKIKTTKYDDTPSGNSAEGSGGTTSNENLIYNNLDDMVIDRNNIVDEARTNDSIKTYQAILDDNEKLPRYDWQDVVEKEYPKFSEDNTSFGKNFPKDVFIETYENLKDIKDVFSEKQNNSKNYFYISGILMFMVLVIILLILLVYVTTK